MTITFHVDILAIYIFTTVIPVSLTCIFTLIVIHSLYLILIEMYISVLFCHNLKYHSIFLELLNARERNLQKFLKFVFNINVLL